MKQHLVQFKMVHTMFSGYNKNAFLNLQVVSLNLHEIKSLTFLIKTNWYNVIYL
jgi:hypothetical protein